MITQDISTWVSASSSNTHTKLPTHLWGIGGYASTCGTEITGHIYLHFWVQTFAKHILYPLTLLNGLNVNSLETYVKRERVT
jgi:hypothetical protein